MPEITTTVKAKSEYGIKTEEWGDEWANWSKPEFRGTPFDTSVKAGDRVQLTYAEADNGKVYISTIDKVITAAERETRALQDDPFPPDEGFPGDEAGTPFPSGPAADAPSEPSAAPGQDLWAKDRLRARTDCIACATGIFKSCLEAGVLKEFPSAETVAAYAASLEKWAKEGAA